MPKIQFEKTEQALEPDLDISEILELSDWEFRTTMINMWRTLMDKVDSMKKQTDNANRYMEILRRNQKDVLEIKTWTEMKECLWGAHW